MPSCSHKSKRGCRADSRERVRHSRKRVARFLASSSTSHCRAEVKGWIDQYDARPERFGPAGGPFTDRDHRHPGHHDRVDGAVAETVHQPVKVDNSLYVRDYSKCILCYKCVEACGEDAQNTFAISVAGRGFDARISTEFDVDLPQGACVFCGNCIGVCPTGALMFRSEHELRAAEMWEEERQAVTRTICSFCRGRLQLIFCPGQRSVK